MEICPDGKIAGGVELRITSMATNLGDMRCESSSSSL
jgi:hypothetical protein